ncbi:MAG: hypothetical protein CR994_03305 [Maribacter sp.]|nr:MAG: hypothetical protein CR994_03305 [Maribacter sp.]
MADNHSDLYGIEVRFGVVTATLEEAGILVGGLFMNADAGLDSKNFRGACDKKDIHANICPNKRNGNSADRDVYSEKEPYDERHMVERANAWMDSCRSLPNRFGTTTEGWKGFNYPAFIVTALKKIKKKRKTKV